MGVFNAVATWLDSILTHFGHGGASGYLIALMTVAGIAGGALLPGVVAQRNQRRGMLMIAVVVTAAAFAVIAVVHNPAVDGLVLVAAGFVLLAGLPVVLDWSELTPDPNAPARRRGFLLLAGNLGGCGPGADRPGRDREPVSVPRRPVAVAGLAGLVLSAAAGVPPPRAPRGPDRWSPGPN